MARRTRPLRRRIAGFALVLAAGLLIAGACGGNDDGAEAPAATPTAGVPGTITIRSGPIQGQDKTALLVYAAPVGGAPAARACIMITSDSFRVPDTVLTEVPTGNDPCAASTTVKVLPPGTYTIMAGIYVPPASEPVKQSSQEVTIGSEAAVVTIDAAALSR